MYTLARLGLIATVAAAALSFMPVQDEGVTVTSLKFADSPIDDLAHVLRVTRISGEYDLAGVTNRAGLLFEIHRKGKRVGDPIRSVFLAGRHERNRQGKFSIQVADTDYLKLGDAGKGNHRVMVAVQEGGTTCRGSIDVPKTVFDFSMTRGGGTFTAPRAEKGRIPLFYRVGGAATAVGAGESLEQVLKNNAESDVLVVYLEVE